MARIHRGSALAAAMLFVLSGADLPARAGSDGASLAPAQLAQADAISLDFTSECVDGMATFKMTNTGDKWPTVGKFSIYRTNGNTLVSQRRMRLSDGQAASFRVKAGGATPIEYGLFVEPEWASRPFRYDAKQVC